MTRRLILLVLISTGVGSALIMGAQNGAPAINEALLAAFTYRNTGPFRMQARIAAIDVPAAPLKDHLYTFYTAPWIGGVWKTTNNGTTFDPLFDREPTQSIGDVTVAPSNSNYRLGRHW